MAKFRFLVESYLVEDIEGVRRQYSHIPEEDFYDIIKLDPTYKEGSDSVGRYGKWLLGLYRKDNPLTYTGNVKELLYDYDNYKNDRNFDIEKDISKFKSISAMKSAVENVTQAELSHRQEVRNRQQARKNANVEKDADLVYEDDDWLVYVPKTYEASCKLGRGTRWCTASTEDGSYYREYSNRGPLFININKHDPSEKYQFHFETSQFMDSGDSSIDLGDFLDANTGLESFYVRTGLYTIQPKPDENGVFVYTGVKVREAYRDKVKKVIVKDGVTSIGEGAFSYCKSLTSIAIPSSVTSIGYEAFYRCVSLTSITIPSSVTNIQGLTFFGCRRLTSITIPSSVTRIGESAFWRCDNLTSITIPSSVISIGEFAFEDCTSLTRITIPSSVTSIGDYAFFDCDNLTIRCKQGSYADKYAQENDIPVEYI